ncbi:Transcriptional Coactivator p15 (PC4) [Geosmithia morbida]|uniref:Transcriptional Coactivator p15 (PC4) n=1 Tax=Geosmithia morbida TaxID=1094350 RepID=A0A9P4Z1L4_9HYPO|nr:Transcriptional Coactivator p15 (PC4) [Geosmithia morbida]KAF4125754.1 Transcriptional Coactivator p15 (PC4) [Geosmithia morbida]
MGGPSKKRGASVIDDADPGDPGAPAPATAKKNKSAAAAAKPAGKDGEGNPFWELSNKRRVGVSQFKNMCFVNVREYYEKDGKTLPGKKGISLSVEQYVALLKAAPGINAALRELGHSVDDVDVDAEEAPAEKEKKKKKARDQSKSNIEATSDEDSA